jgi:hypothetical protein
VAAVLVASSSGLIAIVSITEPRIAPFEWTRQLGPSGVNPDSLVAFADGFALLSGMTVDGVLLWSSSDGSTWDSQPLSDAATQLAALDEGLIAYSVRIGRTIEPVGDHWLEDSDNLVFPDEVRSRQGSGRPSLVDAGGGFVLMSLYGDVWWSADGTAFDLAVADPEWGPGSEVDLVFDSACRPPTRTSPDVPPMVETGSGLVTMISSNPAEPFGIWPVCEPRVWFSEDGRSWTGSETSLGEGAYVYNLAWRDGRYTAVGGFGIGLPAVWTSSDGFDWQQIESFDPGSDIDLYTVEAGPAGWVVLGRDSQGVGTVGWTSHDGLCWLPLPMSVTGGDTAITSEHMVILDRTTYPQIWVGTATGGSGSC